MGWEGEGKTYLLSKCHARLAALPRETNGKCYTLILTRYDRLHMQKPNQTKLFYIKKCFFKSTVNYH